MSISMNGSSWEQGAQRCKSEVRAVVGRHSGWSHEVPVPFPSGLDSLFWMRKATMDSTSPRILWGSGTMGPYLAFAGSYGYLSSSHEKGLGICREYSWFSWSVGSVTVIKKWAQQAKLPCSKCQYAPWGDARWYLLLHSARVKAGKSTVGKYNRHMWVPMGKRRRHL